MRKQPSDMACGTVHMNTHEDQFTIIAYYSAKKIEIVFNDTAYKTFTSADMIRKGHVKDRMKPTVRGVGFMGEGEYVSKKGNKDTPEYTCWKEMMRRCYSEVDREKKFPTYADCTVCEEWHNFQNFAQWYIDNYPQDGNKYHLDKDIKVKGNKIYSPQTCLFVLPSVNVSISNKGR